MRRAIVLALSLALGLGLAVLLCWAAGIGPFDRSAQRETVKVMTFNVFYGGDDYDLETGKFCAVTNGCAETLGRVVAAIRRSGADVVGLEEGEGNTEVIAKRLGWHGSARTQIVSRYPLLDPPGADGAYVLVELEPGKVVAMASVHLPSDPYGPYAIRDGAAAPAVRALELKTRLPMLRERLSALAPVIADGMPVFLVGDFNSPSQLDWTQATADERDEVPYPFAWPVGTAVATAGFRDSYREVHADPVETPGFTWTPGGPETDPKEVHDRIDWVLAAGPAETEKSEILGEDGGPDVDIAAGNPFPSDHRGVVSTFSVEPAETPVLVAVQERRLTVGDELHASFHRTPGDELALHRSGSGGTDTVTIEWGTDDAEADGVNVFRTEQQRPGAYEAILLDGSGPGVLSRSPFWLYARGSEAHVSAGARTFAPGQPITVTWSNAPGNRWDWLGLYKATEKAVPTDGAIPDDSGDYLYYEYTRTAVEGTGAFSRTSQVGGGSWPLPPGRYEVRLMLDDGYRTVARSQPFTVMP